MKIKLQDLFKKLNLNEEQIKTLKLDETQEIEFESDKKFNQEEVDNLITERIKRFKEEKKPETQTQNKEFNIEELTKKISNEIENKINKKMFLESFDGKIKKEDLAIILNSKLSVEGADQNKIFEEITKEYSNKKNDFGSEKEYENSDKEISSFEDEVINLM